MRSVLTLVTFLFFFIVQLAHAQTPKELLPHEMVVKRELAKQLGEPHQEPLKQNANDQVGQTPNPQTQGQVFSLELTEEDQAEVSQSKSAELSKVALEAFRAELRKKYAPKIAQNEEQSTQTKPKPAPSLKVAPSPAVQAPANAEELAIEDLIGIKEKLHQRNVEWQQNNLRKAYEEYQSPNSSKQARKITPVKEIENPSAAAMASTTKSYEEEIALRRKVLEEAQEQSRLQARENFKKKNPSATISTKTSTAQKPVNSAFMAPVARTTGSPLAEVPDGSLYDTLVVNGYPSITITDGGNGIGTNTFTTDYVYYLQGLCFVNEGQTLTIEPGAIIKGMQSQEAPSMLIVAVGGTLVANGTENNPIIFTAESDEILPPASSTNLKANLDEFATGLWGGVAILGDGAINSTSFEFYSLETEGLPVDTRLEFGGGEAISGNLGTSLTYASIRHSGEFNESTFYGGQAGLTLGAVSSEAVVHHVEVIGAGADAFDFIGGDVNASHLIAINSFDVGFESDLGYTGNLQFLFAKDAASFAVHSAGPFENVVVADVFVYNATFIGDGEFGTSKGVKFYNNASGKYNNSIFQDLSTGVDIQYSDAFASSSYDLFELGSLTVNDNVFWNVAEGDYLFVSDDGEVPFAGDPYVDGNITGNTTNIDPGLQTNYVPTNSPVIELLNTGDEFLLATDYAGAFEPNQTPWYTNWSFITPEEVSTPVDPDELLVNGDFESGAEGWSGNAVNVQGDVTNSYNYALVEVPGNPWDVNISQVLDITQGEQYVLQFDAYTDGTTGSRTISAGIGLNVEPFSNDYEDVTLTSEPQTFTLYLSAIDFGGTDSRVLFDMGAATGEVIIDNVSLKVATEASGVDIDYNDYLALIALRDALGGNLLQFWTLDVPPSQWESVDFDGEGMVTGLFLDNHNLSGDVPFELTTLERLGFLSIGGNAITSFPEGMGNLDMLQDIYAWSNQLNSLPSDMFGMALLSNLDVSGNNLSSGNFIGIEALAGTLTRLDIGYNQLFEIPNGVFSLTLLNYLRLDGTEISSIPADIQALTNLSTLRIGFNFLTTIPNEISALSNLREISAPDNQLTNLPDFSNLRSLKEIVLWNNQISASVSSFFVLDSLETLDAFGNQLFGSLDGISGLRSIQGIYLGNNQITGGIPQEMESLIELTDFRVHNNLLEGTLTAGLFQLPSISNIELQVNQITGAFPFTIGSSSLLNLNLSYNELTSLSLSIGFFPNLEIFNFTENNLSGNLPTELSSNTKLRFINLSFNEFTGGIPVEWAGLESLRGIFVTGNNLTEPLPTELSALTYLQYLAIDQNQIPGAIPESYSALTNLQNIYIYDNLLTDLPDWSGLEFVNEFYAYNNYLEFDDFEPLVKVPFNIIELEPQLTTAESFEILAEGNEFTIDATVGGTQNHYTWFFNGQILEADDSPTLTITDFNRSKAGVYTCQITSDSVSQISDLILSSGERIYWINSPVAATDSLALVAIYNATNGQDWVEAENWLDAPVAMWEGVILKEGRVAILDLSNKNLNGPIPPAIGSLTELEWFSLWNNNIAYLPGELFGLSKIHYLDFDNIGLTKLPPAINLLSALDTLWIGGNPFVGKIPNEVFDLTNLTTLAIYNTAFTGTIPEEIGNLTKLKYLSLAGNPAMSGGVPDAIGTLTDLEYLNLSNNFDSGLEKVASLTKLRYLLLYGSPMASKTLPSELSALTELNTLGLGFADYSEGIPEVIWNFQKLKVVQMPDCNINGPLPAGFANWDSLTFLNLRDNGITGGFPEGFNASFMEQFYVHNNSLEDVSPLTEATNLREANLNFNKLDYADLSGLISLVENGAAIYANAMQPTNGEYTYVQTAPGVPVTLTMNFLPSELTSIDWYNANGEFMGSGATLELTSEMVSNPVGDMEYDATSFNSEISNYFGLFIQSGTFDVSVVEPVAVEDSLALIGFYNAITNRDDIILPWLEEGPVENWTGVEAYGGYVRGLYLYGLEGTIPVGTLGALDSLEQLSIVDGSFTGAIPDDIFSSVMTLIDLGRNRFTGNIPETINEATGLQVVGFAGNQLSGSIPSLTLPNLDQLYLDGNGFTGAIPQSLVSANLGGFSVDRNRLDAIPEGLYAALENAFYVNFGYNNFDYFDLANGIGNFVPADATDGVQSVTRSITFTGEATIGGEVTLRAQKLDPQDEFTWFRLRKYATASNPIYDYVAFTGNDSTYTFLIDEETDLTNYIASVTNPNYKYGSYEFLSHSVAVDSYAKRYASSISVTGNSGFKNGSSAGALGLPDSPPNNWDWRQLDNYWYSSAITLEDSDTVELLFTEPIPINYVRLYGPDRLYVRSLALKGNAGEELVLPYNTYLRYFDNQLTFPKTSFAVSQIDLVVVGGYIDAFEIGDTGESGALAPTLSDRYTEIGPDVIRVDFQYRGFADYFVLERSADNENFELLDTVRFTGWYTDFVDQGQFYYRAKAVHESAGVSSEYSNVLFTGNCEPTLPNNKIWRGVSSAPENEYGGQDSQREEVYISSPFYAYYDISDITAGWYDQFFGFHEENGEIRQRCDRLPGRGFSYVSEFDATFANDTLRINWYDNFNDITGFSKFYVVGDIVDNTPPQIPTQTQALLVGSRLIELEWQGADEEYIVQRSVGTPTQYVNVDTVQTNGFVGINELDNGLNYYRILGYKNGLVSLPSIETNIIHKAALFDPVNNAVTTDITRTSYGGSWGDFDGDGDDDLYVTNAFEQPANFLYENTGDGTFRKIIGSIATSEELFTRSSAWGDYDNDGFLDLLVPTRDVLGDRIYHNTGSKSFEIAALEVTEATNNIPSESGVWVDLDNDGYLDIVNSNGMVFTNNGEGGFVLTQRMENQFGTLAELPILIWTVSNVDIDNDGDQDLYFTSDAYNMMFLNDAEGNMTYVENEISNASIRGRGFTWADFNNDGFIDVLTGEGSINTFGLYLNNGDGSFEFYTPDEFVTVSTFPASTYFAGRGYSAGDFDNDGNIDIIGILSERARIFYNNGNAQFTMMEIEDQAFPKTNRFSHLSLADFNKDGALDIFLPNQDFNGASYMYRNNGNANSWLSVQLKGISSNSSGIGARVRVKANNQWQSQTVRSLNGISSGNSLALEFGLSTATIVDSVEVKWPSGLITYAKDVTPNNLLSMVEVPQTGGPTVNQADSTALVAIYLENGGENWNRKQGWLTGSPLGWEGVNFNEDGRVVSLILNDNNLSDTITSQITSLTALQVLDMSGNALEGPIPSALGDMTSLINLTLSDNQLDGTIPSSVGSLVNLENLDLYNNNFFGELPRTLGGLVKLKQFEIHNNGFIGFVPAEIGTLNNLAVLRLDQNDFEGPLPTGLGGMVNLQVLYVNDNHFTDVMPEDIGSLTKLLEFKAQNNEFFGALPSTLSNLKELQYVDISNNQFTGTIAPLALAPFLYYFNANQNRFTMLPDLGRSIADTLLVRNNSLDFGAFELNDRLIKNNRLFVSPQDFLFERIDSLHSVGDEIELYYAVGGSFNTYKWIFNDTTIQATDGVELFESSLIITNPDTPNQGEYVLEITNENYPDVVLRTYPFNLKLSSLERDKQALLAFAAAVNNGSFPVTLNWSESSPLTSDWDGVTVAGDRVTELVLPAIIDTDLTDGDQSQIFEGEVPLSFADLSGLVTLDLKDHYLSSFPNISNWPSISSANISNNRLAFKDIIPNVKLGNRITYIPQRRYDVTVNDTVQAGDDKIVRINMSGTGLKYQWFFGKYIAGQAFNNSVDSIIGANSRLYQIENVDFDKMGTYRVAITHPSVPDLVITSRNRNIMASTDVFGTVYADGSNTLLDDGEVILYRKTPEGPFVAEDTVVLDGGGEYAFTDVVLGDFLALTKPNRLTYPNTIETYYEKADLFANATTIEVRNRVEGIDIEMIFYQEPEIVETGADFEGLVESEFEDEGNQDEEGNGRINSRRKVKKAACSMRRFVRTGRIEEDIYELYAYVESDDEGRFNFEGIEEGRYRLNIEYPGVPMDPNSEIEFEVGGDKENQKFTLLATITENGIVVEAEEVLYSLKPYIKDIKLYPNPTENVMKADFLVYRKLNDLKMEIVDVRGMKLFEEELDHRMGLHTTKIDLSQYDSGVYFMVFTDDAGTFRQQVKIGKK